MGIFIDTWGWLVLGDKKEDRHQEIKTLYCNLRQQKSIFYTTDYILDETFTLLFRRLSFEVAKTCLKIFEQAIQEGYLSLEWITQERFNKAKELRLRFQDKPRISFTDLTSMIAMEEFGFSKILTEDEHFIYVGMGFQKIP